MGLCPDFQPRVRWGAFLRDIPPQRRIGDMAHAPCWVTSCVLNRLMGDQRVLACPALVKQIQELIVAVNQDAAKIPSDTRLAPQRTAGCLDITSTQVFVGVTIKQPIELALLCKRPLGVVPAGAHESFDALLLRVLMTLQYEPVLEGEGGLEGERDCCRVPWGHRAAC